MNELAAETDNSVEPESDNQKPETLLNPTVDEEVSIDEPMPHVEAEAVDHGEKPDHIPKQFWSDENGADLEGLGKAYTELRAKMSSGAHKAPKDGKYDISNAVESGIEEDDEMLSGFAELAKTHGISQDAFNEFTNFYLESMGESEQRIDDTIAETKAKLGRNADKIIADTDRWLTKLGTSGVLNQDELNSIANASNNADFVKALGKIRSSYNEQPMPGIEVMEGQATTRADLDALVADPRYGVDMGFTSSVEKKFMEAFGEA